MKRQITRELRDMPLGALKPYEHNPRKNDRAVAPLMQSIKANGFNAPIIADEAGIILAGHTRYKAAQKLGLKRVPVVVVSGLGENQKKAYRIADNKIAELAKWDFAELDYELEDIDWGEIEAEAAAIDWGALTDKAIAWDDDAPRNAESLGFSPLELDALRADADVGAMLDSFEGNSPIRAREEAREEESRQRKGEDDEADEEGTTPDGDKITFIAEGRRGDFGADFWEIAGQLYARGVKVTLRDKEK